MDYDQDGLADIYLLNYGSGSVNQLFHNNVGGVFEEIASSVGLDVGGDNWDAIFADYDDDNDLDLLTVGDSGTALLKNSAGQFASLSSSKGIADSEPAAAAAWIGSGFLVAGDNGTRLYEYEGSDRFSTDPETSAESAGLDDPGTGSAISLADYDGDGDDDIYLANTTGQNRLFKNLGDGTYQSVEEEAGAVELGNDASTDVNWITLPGDAFPSVFVADYEGNNHFYRNQGDRTFVDQAKDFGLQDPGYTTVSAWAENFINGAPALFLGRWNEEDWDEEDKEPNLLYIPVTNNSGEVTDFENAAHSAGVNDTGQTLDAGWLDYDNDGYLDLLVILYDGGLRLYRNESHEVQLCDE
ncbi:MAG: VCBS repeat-containing protein [Deltaproteobacteria bacterium]|nr:VCBS repeat-containing protein [Deltaproteobacteria bacterium]